MPRLVDAFKNTLSKGVCHSPKRRLHCPWCQPLWETFLVTGKAMSLAAQSGRITIGRHRGSPPQPAPGSMHARRRYERANTAPVHLMLHSGNWGLG